MAKRQKADPSAWTTTPAGEAAYRKAHADAQARANETGFDFGIERNDLFKTYSAFMLPQKRNRFGRDLNCEVVMCENLDKCQTGHGPLAGR